MRTFIVKDYEFDSNLKISGFKLPFFKLGFAIFRSDPDKFYECTYCQGPHASFCYKCKLRVIHKPNQFSCGCGVFADSGIWTKEEERNLKI